MKVAQAISGQILAYQKSVSLVDVDQLPKYGAVLVIHYCLCTTVFIKDLFMLRFALIVSQITIDKVNWSWLQEYKEQIAQL